MLHPQTDTHNVISSGVSLQPTRAHNLQGYAVGIWYTRLDLRQYIPPCRSGPHLFPVHACIECGGEWMESNLLPIRDHVYSVAAAPALPLLALSINQYRSRCSNGSYSIGNIRIKSTRQPTLYVATMDDSRWLRFDWWTLWESNPPVILGANEADTTCISKAQIFSELVSQLKRLTSFGR